MACLMSFNPGDATRYAKPATGPQALWGDGFLGGRSVAGDPNGPTAAALEESHVHVLVALRGTMQEVLSSQVSARGVLEPLQWADPENRTAQPHDTAETSRALVQSLPRTEVHPERVESFEDLIAFIGGRPSLWMELDNNVWLIVVYENEPAPTPAGVYVKVAA